MRALFWAFCIGFGRNLSNVFGVAPIVSYGAQALLIIVVPFIVVARKRREQGASGHGASTIAWLAALAIVTSLVDRAPWNTFVFPAVVALSATLVASFRAADVSPRTVAEFFALR